MKYTIKAKGKRWVVWDVQGGYVQHEGSYESCQEWIKNVTELFG